MNIELDTGSIESYRKFLKVRELPTYRFNGHTASFPDEYAAMMDLVEGPKRTTKYAPSDFTFDYQSAIARRAIEKRKYCVFADCGLGKSIMAFEYALAAAKAIGKRRCVLIVSPAMVVSQTIAEAKRFYGDKLPIVRVPSGSLNEWLASGKEQIGITNYEAFNNTVNRGRLGAIVIDESSMLKSHYGKWGTAIIELAKGLEWKLAMTGTPAPNDRIEYANHAVLMDAFPTVNSFLARYFVNRGQTDNRWEIKPHAIEPFYRDLSHWCIFLTNPATYGWKDNTETLPPIHVHIHDVPLTSEQQTLAQDKTGELFVTKIGGICSRNRLASLSKGFDGENSIPTEKPEYMRRLIDSWPEESTIIWCLYNREQEIIEATFPEAASMSGDTPMEDRERIIEDFKSGKTRILISKPKILGFGLNLQIATRQVFSGLQDSYEQFYQAVKRSNRYGATRPLNVHIPITSLERPMVDTVLSKAKRVQHDAEEVERIFKHAAIGWS